MAVQMTFQKHPSVKNYFAASFNNTNYLVMKTTFGWIAKMRKPGIDQLYEHVPNAGTLTYDNRGQAEYACNLNANGGE